MKEAGENARRAADMVDNLVTAQGFAKVGVTFCD
jgi:hypothetical protein